jgi:aerobic-type carbon monoxide dehydrogenase small subunit (CoxS/CutS family)
MSSQSSLNSTGSGMNNEPAHNLTTESVTLTVNGTVHTVDVEARRTLSEVLREELGLTGTHVGCEHGVCGACTVLVDGVTARSCLALAVQVDGSSIETIESLAQGDAMHPIQQAMWDNHGFQCAFCAPGFLMTIKGLLDRNSAPTREQLHEELSGNLCRCTGYASIVAGAEAAVATLQVLNGGH